MGHVCQYSEEIHDGVSPERPHYTSARLGQENGYKPVSTTAQRKVGGALQAWKRRWKTCKKNIESMKASKDGAVRTGEGNN